MSISNEIRKLQLRGSAEQRQRAAREAKRRQTTLAAKVTGPQTGVRIDSSFRRQLERKAVEARERLGQPQRSDLPAVIDQLRREGKLPPEGGAQPAAPEHRYFGGEGGDGLQKQIERKAAEVRGDGKKQAKTQKVGRDPKVGYEPTPEEILGDDAGGPLDPPEPDETDPSPDADAVLNAGGLTDFTQEELDEISAMNPGPRKGGKGKRR